MRTLELLSLFLAASCAASDARPERPLRSIVVEATLDAAARASGPILATTLGGVVVMPKDGERNSWIDFDVEIPITGRYRTEVTNVQAEGNVWVEDYVGNPDGRTYDITGPMEVRNLVATSGQYAPPLTIGRDGSPLQAGRHSMRLHGSDSELIAASVRFSLLREHRETPEMLQQSTTGRAWHKVWSDEFDGTGVPDPALWLHDIGNWGWGNREPQYYTDSDTDNARQEDGHLIIEARPDDDGHPWTSARLTTRGKVSFLYGRFEIRARVPAADGTWAAGWLLGDDYRDEVSWPYCGEVDIMEAVGREIDDATGDGINHGSCHTRAYYFKQGNHISNTIPVEGMATDFHVYACEWDEREVRMYVDGVHYYTYDKHETPEAWPFDRPQNLILNLAMGGGMGGGIAPEIGSQRIEVDYVRVYERR